MSGLFISFEGGDGAGKSTQVAELADALNQRGYEVVTTREPGGTELGAHIRKLLLHGISPTSSDDLPASEARELNTVQNEAAETGGCDRDLRSQESDKPNDIAPRAEALLFAADRAHHVYTKIRPALERGAIVISDRYLDSSVAYQGGARALAPDDIRNLSLWAADGLLPDVTFLLDVAVEQGFHRVGSDLDRMESQGEMFHQHVRKKFLELAQNEPERFIVIDARLPIKEIAARVWAVVEPRL